MPPSTTTCATWIPCGPNSRAMPCAMARRPALADANAMNGGLPRSDPGRAGEEDRAAAGGHHPTRRLAAHEEAAEARHPPGVLEERRLHLGQVAEPVVAGVEHHDLRRPARGVEQPDDVGLDRRVAGNGRRLPARAANRPATSASSRAAVRPATRTCRPSRPNRLHSAPPRPASAPTPTTIAIRFDDMGSRLPASRSRRKGRPRSDGAGAGSGVQAGRDGRRRPGDAPSAAARSPSPRCWSSAGTPARTSRRGGAAAPPRRPGRASPPPGRPACVPRAPACEPSTASTRSWKPAQVSPPGGS